MAYSAPTTRATGFLVTAAVWNQDVVDNVKFLANPPACRVHHNANQSIPDATETSLAFNSERWDTAALHDTTTNNNRITIPVAGLYLFTFRGNLAAGSDYVAAYAVLQLSSGTNIDKDQRLPTAFTEGAFCLSTQYKMAAGDWVQVRVYQDNSANAARNIVASGQVSPEFSATWIGLG